MKTYVCPMIDIKDNSIYAHKNTNDKFYTSKNSKIWKFVCNATYVAIYISSLNTTLLIMLAVFITDIAVSKAVVIDGWIKWIF